MRSPPSAARSRTRGQRTATGPACRDANARKARGEQPRYANIDWRPADTIPGRENMSLERLWNEVNRIIGELQANGTLSELSVKYHGTDLTGEAALFDITALEQFP